MDYETLSTYLANEFKLSNAIKNRNIKDVYHFTSLENAISIIKYGLCSVSLLHDWGLDYDKNDERRFDQKLEFISLSITYPNYRMLFKYSTDKVMFLIKLDPSILLRPGNKFYEKNAASNKFKSIKRSNTHEDFNNMFTHERKEGISEEYTANSQAEVMSPIYIPSQYFKSFIFRNESDKQLFQNKLEENNLESRVSCDTNISLFTYQVGENIWNPINKEFYYLDGLPDISFY